MSASMSGISVDDDAVNTYAQFKKCAHKYVLFRISDDETQIIVEKKGAKDATYDTFLQDLLSIGAVYAVYDFKFTTKSGAANSKIFFITWCPEGTKVKKRMLLASSKDALKAKFEGIAKDMQASDTDEISQASFLDKLASDAAPGQTCEATS